MKANNTGAHYRFKSTVIASILLLLLIQASSAFASPSSHFKDIPELAVTPKFLTLPFVDASVKITNAWLATGSNCNYYIPSCNHKGTDYTKHDTKGNPITFTVLAAAEGTATCYARATTSDYGNYVDIVHPNGLVTRYAHLQSCEFTSKKVIRGDYLGKAGKTARKNNILTHLHFELRVSGISTDPYGLNKTTDKYPQPGKTFTGATPTNHYWRNFPPKYPGKPAIPSGVKASDGNYTDKLIVSWTAVGDSSKYEVWRNTSNSTTSSVRIANLSNKSISYSDTATIAGATYYYWVKACNYIGCSGFSQPDPGYRKRLVPPTFSPTATATPTASATPTATSTATNDGASETPISTDTPTATASLPPDTFTPTFTPTSTATSEATFTSTFTSTATATFSPPAPIVLQPSLQPAYSGNICDQGTIRGHAWYRISGGQGGTYAYLTLNAASTGSTNSARWQPNISVAGRYKVEVYIPNHTVINWPCTGKTISWDTEKAKYQIYYQGANTSQIINVSPLADAWVNLGTYSFSTGTSGYVLLTDLTGETFATRTVTFGAVRFTYVSP